MINILDIPGMYDELQQVNRHIERLCRSNSPAMQEMIDWVLASRGKQIRPVLTLLCSRLKSKRVDVTELAAVVEICHTASLIHDDIIDDADTRRGRLSVQKKFGREMAVYCGDFMIFATLGRTELRLKPWYRDMFSKLEIMCNGEIGQYTDRYNKDITEEQYIKNIVGKTSAMFSIACGTGAYEGKCDSHERKAVEEFARYFGLLFQIRDDLMDFISNEQFSLKTIHNDLRSGYYTLPVICTLRQSEYRSRLSCLIDKLQTDGGDDKTNEQINKLITAAGGYTYTLRKIEEYKDKAVESLNIFDESAAKQKLLEMMEYLWESVDKLKKCVV